MRILGREPALWLGLVSTIVQMIIAFGVHLTDRQTAAINAAAVAIIGLITAAVVAREQVAPAVLGLLQAALTLGMVFGLHVSASTTAAIMAAAAAGLSVIVRYLVTAPVAQDGALVPRITLYGLAA